MRKLHTEVRAIDSEGPQGVRAPRHQVHNRRCLIFEKPQVDLAKVETSWEVTQPACDGGKSSIYPEGSGKLGLGGRRDPLVGVIVEAHEQRQILKKGEIRDQVEEF